MTNKFKHTSKPANVPQSIRLDLNSCPDVACHSCESGYFKQVFKMKEVSPLQSPSGKKEYVGRIVFVCNSCDVEMKVDPDAGPIRLIG